MPRQGRNKKRRKRVIPESDEEFSESAYKPYWVRTFESFVKHLSPEMSTNIEEPNLSERIHDIHRSNFNSFSIRKRKSTIRSLASSDLTTRSSRISSRSSSLWTESLDGSTDNSLGDANSSVRWSSQSPQNRTSILASGRRSSGRAKLSIMVDGKRISHATVERTSSAHTASMTRSSPLSRTSTQSSEFPVTTATHSKSNPIVTELEDTPKATLPLPVKQEGSVAAVTTTEDKATQESFDLEQEAVLQQEENTKYIKDLLSDLEKPSCCSRGLARLQVFLHRACCKYTPKIYFNEPISWYSATAKLDAGSLLRENCLGITAGLLIAYVSFFFFSAAFSHVPHIATLAACYVMLFAVFGIAYSPGVRCVLLITLPYLVASRTRWLLMMVATGLVTTGPALNFMHNSGNFRNGIACVMGQVSSNVELMGKITKAPLGLIKNQLGSFIEDINKQITQARNAIQMVKDAILKITKVLDTKSDWVRSMIESCGDEISMKNQCLAFMNTLYFNCVASMAAMAFFCNTIRMFAEQACKSVSGLNDICERESSRVISEVSDHAPVSEDQLQESEESLLRFMGHDEISMEVSDSFVDADFGTNMSSQTEMTDMIEQKMDLMMDGLNAFKRTMSWVVVVWTLFTVLQMIVQSAVYKKNWVKKPFFDNGYITDTFVQQERRAFENKRPTTLPLSFGERTDYVTFSALMWSRPERKTAFGSLVFLLLGMVVLILIVVADYAMYQVVLTTAPAFSSGFGEAKEALMGGLSESIPDFGVGAGEQTIPEVQGNSSMSEMGRSFMALANPLKDVAFSVDASICRPRASKPNDTTTILVGVALSFTLLSIVVQVYILRLRHLILQWYYPECANRRAAWLRAYIRNTRGLFYRLVHKFRNRKLKVPAEGAPPQRLKGLDRLIFLNPGLASCLALVGIIRIFCAQCSDAGNPKKKVDFAQKFDQCPRCGVYYCKTCQSELKGICVDCNVPINVLSIDIDFERWSSDDEYDYFYNKYYTRRPHDEFLLPTNSATIEETLQNATRKREITREKANLGLKTAQTRLFFNIPQAANQRRVVKRSQPSKMLEHLGWFKGITDSMKRRKISPSKNTYSGKRMVEEIRQPKLERPQKKPARKIHYRHKKTQTPLVRLSAIGGSSRWAWRASLCGIGAFRLRQLSSFDDIEVGEPDSLSTLHSNDISDIGQPPETFVRPSAAILGNLSPIDIDSYKRPENGQPGKLSLLEDMPSNFCLGGFRNTNKSYLKPDHEVPGSMSPLEIGGYGIDAIACFGDPGRLDDKQCLEALKTTNKDLIGSPLGTLSGISPLDTFQKDITPCLSPMAECLRDLQTPSKNFALHEIASLGRYEDEDTVELVGEILKTNPFVNDQAKYVRIGRHDMQRIEDRTLDANITELSQVKSMSTCYDAEDRGEKQKNSENNVNVGFLNKSETINTNIGSAGNEIIQPPLFGPLSNETPYPIASLGFTNSRNENNMDPFVSASCNTASGITAPSQTSLEFRPNSSRASYSLANIDSPRRFSSTEFRQNKIEETTLTSEVIPIGCIRALRGRASGLNYSENINSPIIITEETCDEISENCALSSTRDTIISAVNTVSHISSIPDAEIWTNISSIASIRNNISCNKTSTNGKDSRLKSTQRHTKPTVIDRTKKISLSYRKTKDTDAIKANKRAFENGSLKEVVSTSKSFLSQREQRRKKRNGDTKFLSTNLLRICPGESMKEIVAFSNPMSTLSDTGTLKNCLTGQSDTRDIGPGNFDYSSGRGSENYISSLPIQRNTLPISLSTISKISNMQKNSEDNSDFATISSVKRVDSIVSSVRGQCQVSVAAGSINGYGLDASFQHPLPLNSMNNPNDRLNVNTSSEFEAIPVVGSVKGHISPICNVTENSISSLTDSDNISMAISRRASFTKISKSKPICCADDKIEASATALTKLKRRIFKWNKISTTKDKHTPRSNMCDSLLGLSDQSRSENSHSRSSVQTNSICAIFSDIGTTEHGPSNNSVNSPRNVSSGPICGSVQLNIQKNYVVSSKIRHFERKHAQNVPEKTREDIRSKRCYEMTNRDIADVDKLSSSGFETPSLFPNTKMLELTINTNTSRSTVNKVTDESSDCLLLSPMPVDDNATFVSVLKDESAMQGSITSLSSGLNAVDTDLSIRSPRMLPTDSFNAISTNLGKNKNNEDEGIKDRLSAFSGPLTPLPCGTNCAEKRTFYRPPRQVTATQIVPIRHFESSARDSCPTMPLGSVSQRQSTSPMDLSPCPELLSPALSTRQLEIPPCCTNRAFTPFGPAETMGTPGTTTSRRISSQTPVISFLSPLWSDKSHQTSSLTTPCLVAPTGLECSVSKGTPCRNISECTIPPMASPFSHNRPRTARSQTYDALAQPESGVSPLAGGLSSPQDSSNNDTILRSPTSRRATSKRITRQGGFRSDFDAATFSNLSPLSESAISSPSVGAGEMTIIPSPSTNTEATTGGNGPQSDAESDSYMRANDTSLQQLTSSTSASTSSNSFLDANTGGRGFMTEGSEDTFLDTEISSPGGRNFLTQEPSASIDNLSPFAPFSGINGDEYLIHDDFGPDDSTSCTDTTSSSS